MKRKYPTSINKLEWSLSLLGVKILASNDAFFNKKDTIAIIDNILSVPTHTIRFPRKTYRYIKVEAPDNKYHIQVAELSFEYRGDHINRPACLPGTGDEIDIDKLFDNDPLSSSTISQGLTLDFGASIALSAMQITSRNDDNYIRIGDQYELLYMDKQGWVSMGKKIAVDTTIEWEEAPCDALFWLRNISRGREERIFTYEDGKTIFW